MAVKYRWLAVAAIWCFLFEWWHTASATCTNCQTVGWSGQKECRHCGVKKSSAAALSTTKVQSWSGWTQPKPNSSSQVSQQLQQVAAQLQSVCGNDPAQASQSLDGAYCRVFWSGELIRQIKQVEKALCSLDMDAPALESARKMLEQQLTELKTQQKAQQPLSKRMESARGALQRAQRRAEEASVAFTLAQTVKEQADQAARIQVELCTLEQEAHKAATEATGARPLDRCSDIIDNTISALQSWSACRAPGEGTTSSLHTHQWSARVMHSCGSGDGCRRVLSKASQDEEIARSGRRRLTYKRSQTGKEISAVTHEPWRSPARSTHNAVRVNHTERFVLATVNVKSLKPKELSRSHKYGVDTNSTIDQIDRDTSLHGCHVIGVQESCIKGNVTREQRNPAAHTSGANGKGQLGVEAWVHRSVLMRARVRTEPCSHLLLVLKIDGKIINLTVIVAHAPPVVQDPWLSSSMRMDEWEFPRADSYGGCPRDVANANGSELRTVFEERNLHAVSTFTPVFQPTWWSGRAQH